jgi:hypothetical protein
MAAFIIFQKPKEHQTSFGPRLFDAYRQSQAVKPFNYKLKWLGKDVAAWETVEQTLSGRCADGRVHGPAHPAARRRTQHHLREREHGHMPRHRRSAGSVHEPFRLAQLIEEAFHKLQVEAGGTAPRTARRPNKPARSERQPNTTEHGETP